jgi:hypothetical protein
MKHSISDLGFSKIPPQAIEIEQNNFNTFTEKQKTAISKLN